MKKKERLDKVLLDRGLVKSRERARALIMEGKVSSDGMVLSKAGALVDPHGVLTVKDDDNPYVSRGGLKLAAALDHFGIDPAGMVAMDVGCSTGGFTDCLLKKDARKVYAIDVGYGQFDWSLRRDPRVVLMEKTNIRYLDPDALPEQVNIAVVDVSFISLLKVLPRIREALAAGGVILALVKPQFEVGRERVGKGGIVRDEEARLSAVESVCGGASDIGLTVIGFYECPVPGQKGNREYFIRLENG